MRRTFLALLKDIASPRVFIPLWIAGACATTAHAQNLQLNTHTVQTITNQLTQALPLPVIGNQGNAHTNPLTNIVGPGNLPITNTTHLLTGATTGALSPSIVTQTAPTSFVTGAGSGTVPLPNAATAGTSLASLSSMGITAGAAGVSPTASLGAQGQGSSVRGKRDSDNFNTVLPAPVFQSTMKQGLRGVQTLANSEISGSLRPSHPKDLLLLSGSEAVLSQQEDGIDLKSGQLLVSNSKSANPARVSTAVGEVLIGKGGAALITAKADTLQVVGLLGSPKTVRLLKTAAPSLGIHPGFEVTVGNVSLSALSQGESRARRSTIIASDMPVAVSEISLPNLIARNPLLKTLRANTIEKDAQGLVGQLLKQAAAIVVVRGTTGFVEQPPVLITSPKNTTTPNAIAASERDQTVVSLDVSANLINGPQTRSANRASLVADSPLNSNTNNIRPIVWPTIQAQSAIKPTDTKSSKQYRDLTRLLKDSTEKQTATAQNHELSQTLSQDLMPSSPSLIIPNVTLKNSAPPVAQISPSERLTGSDRPFDYQASLTIPSITEHIQRHPEGTLAFIAVIVLLLLLTLYLAQSIWQRNKQLEVINARLKSEIAEREKAELEIQRLNSDLTQRVVDLGQMGEALSSARDQAVEASRLKSEFVANISHEIRTPISAVLGMLNILTETRLTKKQKEMMQTIQNSADSMLTLINDILDFSKIEAGKLNLESVHFSVESVFSEVDQLLKPKAENKGISLEHAYDSNIPEFVCGDPIRLRQVLVNLVDNAIKFTDAGVARFEARREASEDGKIAVRFSVIDSGIGIPGESAQKLFNPFVQADGSTTRKYGGTGLGLVICKRLVELMGGDIWFESKENKGSTFFFRIPFMPANLVQLPAKEMQPQPVAIAHDDPILVVDDSPVLRRVVIHQLKKFQLANIDTASNGIEAVEACRNKRYSMVLMDWQMPELDGLGATKLIREFEKELGITTPIIAMTANAMEGDRLVCLDAGMNDYLSKPFTEEQLRMIVDRWSPAKTKERTTA